MLLFGNGLLTTTTVESAEWPLNPAALIVLYLETTVLSFGETAHTFFTSTA